jgi:catechol 2,3-dioxygenase-like lactoylglutathione lyase family enzyme
VARHPGPHLRARHRQRTRVFDGRDAVATGAMVVGDPKTAQGGRHESDRGPRADTSATAVVDKADMKLEVVTVPVSDVDRAKRFYVGLGWRLDADFGSRGVQLTPPGSGCSIQFRSRRRHLRLLRHLQRSGRQRLDPAGGHDAVPRTRHGRHDLHLGERPVAGTSPRRGRARRARGTDRRGRRELAGLVRRVHGAGAVRPGTAHVTAHAVTAGRSALG